MIVIVVSVGATLFAFASNGFGTLSNDFQNLFSNSSNQIVEDVVMRTGNLYEHWRSEHVWTDTVLDERRNKPHHNFGSLRAECYLEHIRKAIHELPSACQH